MLVFEDGVVLTEHYAIIHREKRTTQVVFGFSLREDDEEETKISPHIALKNYQNQPEEPT